MPAIADMVSEETPRVLVVLVRHEDPDACLLARLVAHVFLPDHRQKQRTRRVHDSDVRKQPVVVIGLQKLHGSEEEGMLWDRSHGVVRDARRHGATHPRGIGKEGIQTAVAAIVQVNIRAAEVGEHEVADRVGALDGIFVVIKGVQEPRVFLLDKVARFLVGPELNQVSTGADAYRRAHTMYS